MQLLAAIALFLVLAVSPARADHLLFVTDSDFPPYSFMQAGQIKGIDVEIIEEAARRSGLEVGVELYPWKRVLRMVETGEADGAFSLFRTPERSESFIFSRNPVHESVMGVFVSAGSQLGYDSLDDLYGRTVFVPAGFAVSQRFDAAVDRGRINRVDVRNAEDGIQRLLLTDHAYLVSNHDSVLYHSERMGVRYRIKPLFSLVRRRKAYLVMTRIKDGHTARKQEFDRLDRELGRMIRDGTVARIVGSYVR